MYKERIENINSPQEIIWRDTYDVILVKDEYIFQYNMLNKKMWEIGKREPNDFVGIDENGDVVLCSIEHYMINSKEEYSTIFRVNGKELKFFPTIRPITFRGDTITAVTALDFLEQHFYEITISTGEIKEVEEPKRFSNDDLYIDEDIFGNVYINCDVRNLFMEAIHNVILQLASYLGI